MSILIRSTKTEKILTKSISGSVWKVSFLLFRELGHGINNLKWNLASARMSCIFNCLQLTKKPKYFYKKPKYL